jgi:Histidine kinase
MTDVIAAAGTAPRAPGRTFALVRDSWRRLTLRHFGLALSAGLALGGMKVLSYLLWVRGEDPWWLVVAGLVLPMLAQAILLLLALAVAVNIEAARIPKWWPFAIAATVATVVAILLNFGMAYVLSTAAGVSWTYELRGVVTYVWDALPYMLIIGVLAAFGAMHAADAARRTGTLHNLQMERMRVARESYEARLAAMQARVEPRFLFETLSDVEVLYERDAELGARVLDDLIVYLRAALPAIEDTSSTLDAELTLARTWLDITRIRAAGRLWLSLPESRFDARMPPMLLLPLVQHAVEGWSDAARAVFVSVAIADERVRITVVGSADVFARSGEAPAIAAIRKRLRTIYAEQAELVLEATPHDQSQAILEIPYERTDRRPC